MDEAALPTGTFRLRARGSAGGHNGLKSVEAALQSREYARLRIGVGPPPQGLGDLADYVLAPFEREELDLLDPLWPTMAEAVECWLAEGIEVAMRQLIGARLHLPRPSARYPSNRLTLLLTPSSLYLSPLEKKPCSARTGRGHLSRGRCREPSVRGRLHL